MSKTGWSNRLHGLFPTQPYISPRDKIYAALGAFLGILGLGWITLHVTPGLAPLMVASMGASAVLLFAAPHSPLTQPWPFVGGHLLSALIGVSCYRWVPDPWLASASAVALAILAMSLLHCLHPPGGATALTAVIGGDAVHDLGFQYALSPVGINVLVLLILSLIINRLLSPQRHGPASPAEMHKPSHTQGIAPEDLAFALREIGSFIDVSAEDLENIHALAAEHAYQRAVPTEKSVGSMMTGVAENGVPSHPTPRKILIPHMKTLFSLAFRPFFLLAASFSVLSLLGWGLHLIQYLPWPETPSPRLHHGHEMLFGFAGAAIAGFLLTAVATWTQRPAVSGARLAVLCGFWLAARLGAVLPGGAGTLLWALGSALFWLWLTALMAGEVLPARNARNYKVLPLLLAFVAVEAVFFLAGTEQLALREAALRAGLMLIIGLILLVGGRIIPNFTLNWLKQNRPGIQIRMPSFDQWDLGAVVVTAFFAVGFVLRPLDLFTGWLGLAAGLAQAGRLARWQGWRTGREPLLWILHVGFGWIPVGLALLGLAALGQPLWLDAGLHALTVGAIGTMVLGVMARVALGHTGRLLTAPSGMTLAFVLITLGAALRVFAPAGHPAMMMSMPLWLAAYALFLIRYTPILLAPRADAR
jgi:uncharacterized protein involved in response to NO